VTIELGISGVIGLLFGSLLAWLALRSHTATLQAHLSLREKELAAAKADLARLLDDQKKLLESRARLESALELERKASNEKIELLTKAGEDLQNAFKALAADALKSNNLSFLQIAQETLKRFQSEAKGDLEARQKAVADLVAPVRDSLTKVDAQIQQM
jgi:DNA recombination protein RmuC